MNTTRSLWTMLLLAAAATVTVSAQDSSSSTSATAGATSAPARPVQFRDRLQALPPGVAVEAKPAPFGATVVPGAASANAAYREVVIPTTRVAQVTAPVRWNYENEAASNVAWLSASRQGPVTFLGVSASQPSPELSAQLPVPPDTGLLVDAVTEGSPAQKAGVQQNDVLTKLDDQILIHPRQLFVLVANHKEGESVKISLLRKGQPQEITAVLGKRGDEPLSSSDFSATSAKLGDIDVMIDGKLQRPLRTFTRRLELSNDAPKGHLSGSSGSSSSAPAASVVDPAGDRPGDADDSDGDDVHQELRQLRQALESLNRKLEEKR